MNPTAITKEHAEFASGYVSDSIVGAARLDRLTNLFYAQFEEDENGTQGIFYELPSVSGIRAMKRRISDIKVSKHRKEIPINIQISGEEFSGENALFKQLQALTSTMEVVDNYCVDSADDAQRMTEVREASLASIIDIGKKYNALESIQVDKDAFSGDSDVKRISEIDRIAKRNNQIYTYIGTLIKKLEGAGIAEGNYEHLKVSPKQMKSECKTYKDASESLERMKKIAFIKSQDVTTMLVRLMFQNGCDSVVDLNELGKVNEYNYSAAQKIKNEIEYYVNSVETKTIFPDMESRTRYESVREGLLNEAESTLLYLDALRQQSNRIHGIFSEDRENQTTLNHLTIAKDIMEFSPLPKLVLEERIPKFPENVKARDYRTEAVNYAVMVRDLSSQTNDLNSELEILRKTGNSFAEQIDALRSQSEKYQTNEEKFKGNIDRLERRVNSYETEMLKVNRELGLKQNEFEKLLAENAVLRHKLRIGTAAQARINEYAATGKSASGAQQRISQAEKRRYNRNDSLEGAPLKLIDDEQKSFAEKLPNLEEIVHFAAGLIRKIRHKETYSGNVASIDAWRPTSVSVLFNSLYAKHSTKYDNAADVRKLCLHAQSEYKTRPVDFNLVFKALGSGAFYYGSIGDLHDATAMILEKYSSYDIPHIIGEINLKKPSKIELFRRMASRNSVQKESTIAIARQVCQSESIMAQDN